jgi:hypothetical protein
MKIDFANFLSPSLNIPSSNFVNNHKMNLIKISKSLENDFGPPTKVLHGSRLDVDSEIKTVRSIKGRTVRILVCSKKDYNF